MLTVETDVQGRLVLTSRISGERPQRLCVVGTAPEAGIAIAHYYGRPEHKAHARKDCPICKDWT